MFCYSAYSNDPAIRFMATSGGVGTTLLKAVFDQYVEISSISFRFDPKSLKYQPYIIHSFSEYIVTGSIYHEIDLCGFIVDHISEIHGFFCCFALPCQVRRIQKLLEKYEIPYLILGLACSGSQSIEATFFLLNNLHIAPAEVSMIRYRGNGWPGNIKITLKDGREITCPNNNSIWEKIFHSKLFIQHRCFYCRQTISEFADISLADPWLPEFVGRERIGVSLIAVNTKQGDELFKIAHKEKYIIAKEISEQKLLSSQQGTILRKACYSRLPAIPWILFAIVHNRFYRRIILKWKPFFLFHCFCFSIVDRGLMFLLRRKLF